MDATYHVRLRVFSELGAEVISIFGLVNHCNWFSQVVVSLPSLTLISRVKSLRRGSTAEAP